jgi:hypothetical protein
MSPDALSTPSQDELLTHQLGALLGDLLREKFDSIVNQGHAHGTAVLGALPADRPKLFMPVAA